jgi:hypothetical protein
MSTSNQHSLASVIFGAALLLAGAQGCGDDGDDNPTPPDITTGGSNTTGGKSGTAGSTTTGGKSGTAGTKSNPDGGTASTDGGTTSTVGGGNEGGTGEPPIPACELPELGEDGCFNCPQDGELGQWLNRCSDSDCEPFDNQARLPLLEADGSVPALPN